MQICTKTFQAFIKKWKGKSHQAIIINVGFFPPLMIVTPKNYPASFVVYWVLKYILGLCNPSSEPRGGNRVPSSFFADETGTEPAKHITLTQSPTDGNHRSQTVECYIPNWLPQPTTLPPTQWAPSAGVQGSQEKTFSTGSSCWLQAMPYPPRLYELISSWPVEQQGIGMTKPLGGLRID
jgi:hypothetical protein